MRNLILRAAIVATLIATGATGAYAQKLQVQPSATALALPKGKSEIGDRIFAYVPASVSGAAPVIVLLPGLGMKADDFLSEFTGEANRRGAVLVSIAPAVEGTWTLKPDGKGGADFGAEPARIDSALSAAFAKLPIDPARTVILGFSDGGSYALSLGIANPQLFSGVIALSPRTVWLTGEINPAQKLFIAHGMRDTVVTIKNSRDTIVPGLEKAGFRPAVSWFNADHELNRRSIADALDYVLGK